LKEWAEGFLDREGKLKKIDQNKKKKREEEKI